MKKQGQSAFMRNADYIILAALTIALIIVVLSISCNLMKKAKPSSFPPLGNSENITIPISPLCFFSFSQTEVP